MLREHPVSILMTVLVMAIFVFEPAIGDSKFTISFHGSALYGRDIETYVERHSHRGDKITSEKRRGYQVDDWIERGSSSVTESPKFKDGIRLATWSTQYGEEYDYAIASAIYTFEIPSVARSVKIKIHYDGEAGKHSIDDSAGRLWIRANSLKDSYEEYYPGEGRYEDEERPLYGDTFVLRKKKHDEEIVISSRDHTTDGVMELHVIAEGGQRIDVDYIQVEAYTSLPEVKVVTKEYKGYISRPWYYHTYLYFYIGPVYHFDGHNYVRYVYPRDRYRPIEIRRQYGSYLREYHTRHPRLNIHWSGRIYFSKGIRIEWNRDRLSKWTPGHEETRKSYIKTRKPVEIQRLKERIRDMLSEHRRPVPESRQENRKRRKE